MSDRGKALFFSKEVKYKVLKYLMISKYSELVALLYIDFMQYMYPAVLIYFIKPEYKRETKS